MATPLLIFAAISSVYANSVINWLTNYKRQINVITGLIMLGISLYYLIFVFKVFS